MRSGKSISILIVLACMLATVGRAQNKTGPDGNPIPIDATDESHHSVVFENEDVRVLSFDLGPQKTTPLFVHSNDWVEVTLSDADLQVSQDAGAYGNPQLYGSGVTPSLRGVAKFRYGQRPQIARNPETMTSYRAVEVEIKTPSRSSFYCYPQNVNCQTDAKAVPLALERDKSFAQTLDRDTVRITDVQVLPKEEWKSHMGGLGLQKANPYVVVAVSDVDLIDTSQADDALEFKAPSGGVQWAPKSFLGTLKNVGDKPARFVIVELK
jgi:hypothetical protein